MLVVDYIVERKSKDDAVSSVEVGFGVLSPSYEWLTCVFGKYLRGQ